MKYTTAGFFANYFKITKVTKEALYFGDDVIFYRQANYPMRMVLELEDAYNNIQGKWYLLGYDVDAYITFTDHEWLGKRAIIISHNYNYKYNSDNYVKAVFTSIAKYPYYSYYYSLLDYMEWNGITLSDGKLTTVGEGGVIGVFHKTPTATGVSGVSLDKTNVNMEVTENTVLAATILPHNATNTGITWSSANPAIATVDIFGRVTAVSIGETIITATTEDGAYQAKCTVTVVTTPASGVSLNRNTANVFYKKDLKLVATVAPSNATNKKVIWTSSDNSIASVDIEGVVIGHKLGSATITATTGDGSFSDSCVVTVVYEPMVATGNIGRTSIIGDQGIFMGMYASANATGGDGNYSYYIELYYNNTLVSVSTDPTKNIIYYNQSLNGVYRAEITVYDGDGNEASKTVSITLG